MTRRSKSAIRAASCCRTARISARARSQRCARVPELVFVNCCHLAARDAVSCSLDEPYDRARFAAGVAEALIEIGVRCVIAAGWAVDDDAGERVRETFYDALLPAAASSMRSAQAREAAWRAAAATPGRPTSATAIPTGPSSRDGAGGQRPTPPADEFAGVTSPTALLIALETLSVQSEFQGRTREAARQDSLSHGSFRVQVGRTSGGSPRRSARPACWPRTPLPASRGTNGRCAPTMGRRRSGSRNSSATFARASLPPPQPRRAAVRRARRRNRRAGALSAATSTRAERDRTVAALSEADCRAGGVDGAREPVRVGL